MTRHAVAAAPPPTAALTDTERTTFLFKVVERVNNERIRAGLLPLKVSNNLLKAAENYARSMAENHYFEARTPDGRDADSYAFAQGFNGPTGHNLYRGRPNADEIISLWLSDDTNRANLLNKEYDEIGVGYCQSDDKYGSYVVLELGHHLDAFPVVIDKGAYSVKDPKVQLSVYGEGKITRARFSNDGVNFTDWEPFQKVREWTLLPGEGKRTIFAELSDGTKVYTSQDSVILRPVVNPPAPRPAIRQVSLQSLIGN